MTNKEAIDRLNGMQSRCENGYDAEAIYLAIKALEFQETITCGMPSDTDRTTYTVTSNTFVEGAKMQEVENETN